MTEYHVKKSTNAIDFLRSAADLLPSENRTHLLLKSYYMIRSNSHAVGLMNVARRTAHDDAIACRKCCTKWQDNQYRLSVRPASNTKQSAKNLVQRSESQSNGLSASDRILARKYRKSVSTVATTTCTMCQTKRRTVIRQRTANEPMKRKTKAPAVVAVPDEHKPIDLATVELVKKKKKKTDKTAGLNIPAALNVPALRPPETPHSPFPTPIHNVVLKTPTAMPVNVKKFNKTAPPQSKQSIAIVAQDKPANKWGKQPKPKPKQVKVSAMEKKAADAKQKNSMLLLANVLKMKDAPSTNRPSGLEALLRK